MNVSAIALTNMFAWVCCFACTVVFAIATAFVFAIATAFVFTMADIAAMTNVFLGVCACANAN